MTSVQQTTVMHTVSVRRPKEDPPGSTGEESIMFIPICLDDDPDEEAVSEEYGKECPIDEFASKAKGNAPKGGRTSACHWWMIGTTVFVIMLLTIVLSVTLTNKSDSAAGVSASMLKQTLVNMSFTEGEEFSNNETHQSKAWEWVQNDQLSTGDAATMDRAIQRYALACIHYSTKKDPSSTYIPSGIGWLTSTDECEWLGIKCNDQNQVTSIDLSMNQLNGTVPMEAAYLNGTLTELHLANTGVANQGTEGHAFLAYLRNLEVLDISDTQFANDGLPVELGLLSNLRVMKAARVQYHGTLNTDIFEIQRELEELDLSEISFASSLFPLTLSFLPKLHSVILVNTSLQGDFDIILQQPWQSLGELRLDGSDMVGSLPSNFLERSKDSLKVLSITHGRLEGSIPDSIGSFKNLQLLALHDNKLTGTIPSSLGNLGSLEILELTRNELRGEVPEEVCLNRDDSLATLETDCNIKVDCTCCTCCGYECYLPVDAGVR